MLNSVVVSMVGDLRRGQESIVECELAGSEVGTGRREHCHHSGEVGKQCVLQSRDLLLFT